MTDELLKEILEELKFQSQILEKLYVPKKVPPEISGLMESLILSVKDTPMEQTLNNLKNLLKRGNENGD